MTIDMRHLLTGFLFASALLPGVEAFAEKAKTETPATQKTDYRFRQKATPKTLSRYNTVVFPLSDHMIATMRGDHLLEVKKDKMLSSLEVIPTGVSFGVIETDKKGNSNLYFYSSAEADTKVGKFDVKKYGVPTAFCYTRDGRRLLVATDRGLWIMDPRTLQPAEQMELPFAPTSLAVSENGYYLAMSADDRVAVYNFEEKKLRRDWTYGVKVNDITFNGESTEFAVLTNDGLLTVYETRTFNIKNDIDELGEGLACAFSPDGKYMAIATSPTSIEMVNLVRPDDRNTMPIETGGVNDVEFIKDSYGNTILAFTNEMAIGARRLLNLEPHYAKLVSDQVDHLMDEWLKMMPGESMEDYKLRVNDETRKAQRRLFEDELSTQFAGDLLADETLTLGNYDRANQLLAIGFSKMPTIYLPVPEGNISAFHNAGDLLLSDVQYGLLPDDTFEIIYAKVFNKADGKTYEYNNLNRQQMAFMANDANVVSLEILQQQQMEELRLQELRERVVEEAKHNDLISNHTNISVDSKIVPDYNANGEKILNYVVNFTYQVDPDFSASEDFPPGKYTIPESGAASSMLKIVEEAFQGDFAQYLKDGKKLRVTISGTADGAPIIRTIPYDGSYGDFIDEPIYENGELTAVTVTKDGGVKENRQLAFLRAMGVKNHLENNVEAINNMDTDYTYRIDVAEGKGGEFRRITANFVFVDVF